jgi:hypothetical protein
VVNVAPGDIVGNEPLPRDQALSSMIACVVFDQTDNQPVVVHRTG